MTVSTVKHLLWIAATALVLASCGDAPRAAKERAAKDEWRELIADPSFRRGMALSPLSPATVTAGGGFGKTNVDTLRFVDCDEAPAWQAAQWWSRHDLAGTARCTGESCAEFSNEGKRIALGNDGTLTLEIRTSTEYDAPRTADGQWPHLLIQQDFADAPRVGDLAGLRFGMSVRLLYCHNRMGSDFDETLHTAQAPFYLYLRNTAPASPDFGEALWVGVPTFDYRYERLADTETVHWDKGTSTYIYTIPPRSVWGDISFHDRMEHCADIDLLPLVVRAFEAMRERGCFASSTLDDMTITGMNFGWEVPGTFDAALEVKGISLAAERKPASRPVRVRMSTTMGDIMLELDDRTPRHRDNFAELVREGYFDSLLFHRVIEGFMIQGGDPRTRDITGAEFDADGPETGEQRYWEDIEAEIRYPELYHRRGVLAAAREGDDVNPARRSSRTQFYIVWGRTFDDEALDRMQERMAKATDGRYAAMPDSVREAYRTAGGTPHLDGQYTVFGRVVEGLETVEAIQRTPTDSLDRPVTDVRILRARVER